MPDWFIAFEVLITLLGVLLWKIIKDKHMYGFTSLCAFALLGMTLESVHFDGRFGYFRLIQLVTSAAAAILLALAARNRERRKLAIAGSLLLMGYFTAAFAYVFLPLPQASPWFLPGGHQGHITVTMKFLLPLLVVLLPLTPPVGVLSLARALLRGRSIAGQS